MDRVHVFSHEVVVTLSTGHIDCYFVSYFHVQNKIYDGRTSFIFNEIPCHDTWDRDLELIADFYIILVVYRIESVCPIKIHFEFHSFRISLQGSLASPLQGVQ